LSGISLHNGETGCRGTGKRSGILKSLDGIGIGTGNEVINELLVNIALK
jgi:hypothetical protein